MWRRVRRASTLESDLHELADSTEATLEQISRFVRYNTDQKYTCEEGKIDVEIATKIACLLESRPEDVTASFPGYDSYKITQDNHNARQQPKVTSIVPKPRIVDFVRQFPQFRPLFASLHEQGYFVSDLDIAEMHILWQRGADVAGAGSKNLLQKHTKGSSTFGWHQDTAGGKPSFLKTIIVCLKASNDGNGVRMAGFQPVTYETGSIFSCDSDAMHCSISGSGSDLSIKIAIFLERVDSTFDDELDKQAVAQDLLKEQGFVFQKHKKATARLDCTGYVFARPAAIEAGLPDSERGLSWEFELAFTEVQSALVAMAGRLAGMDASSPRRIGQILALGSEVNGGGGGPS